MIDSFCESTFFRQIQEPPAGQPRAQEAPFRSRESPAGPRAQEAPFRSREPPAGSPRAQEAPLRSREPPAGLPRAQEAPLRSRESPAGLPRAQEAPFRSRESPAGLPGIIIGRLLDLTLVLLLTAFRKETLQFPDFANLFRGGRFSYASRLEAIFDLFAIDLHSGRPSKAPHI